MLVKHQIEIDAPVETVWKLWQDLEGWPVWYPGMISVTRKKPGPAGMGTVFIQKMKIGSLQAPVTTRLCEFSEPACIAWKGGGPGLKVVHRILLDDLGSRTRVRSEETWDGFLSPLAALVREMIDEVTINCLEGLKAYAERLTGKAAG
ncbi:MAG: SRPBCC family protein [Deltaproteobacteria bacterium]|nr:SRPBCC family protein [Deltaproteobacteria bacterium]